MDDVVLVANRFVALRDGNYLDLATAGIATLTRGPIEGEMRATLGDCGSRLCRLWHPSLAPYLDFGPLGETDWFEAVATASSDVIPILAAARCDVEGFLSQHGLTSVTLEQTAPGILRPSLLATNIDASLEATPAVVPVRGFGIRILEPPLVSALTAWLEEPLEAGPHVWSIDAPPQSGWRTCWTMLAREARRLGFVPVDAALLWRAIRGPSGRTGTWLSKLRERPLLISHHTESWTDVARQNLAALVLVVGGLQSATSIVLDVVRRGRPGRARFTIEPISPFSLARAAWTGVPPIGQRRLRDIAARVDGRPGKFVDAISCLMSTGGNGAPVVHERRLEGLPYSNALNIAAVDRVFARVRVLESRGRNAQALRELRRERGALQRRGQHQADLRIWAALAIREGRRRATFAITDWTRAWRTAGDRGDCQYLLDAIPDVARTWIRDAALVDAERLLRAALAAAGAADLKAPMLVTILLAESLYWQGRLPELRTVLANCDHALVSSLRARAALREGDEAAAFKDAIAASARAREVGDDGANTMGLAARLHVEAIAADLDGVVATTNALQKGLGTFEQYFADEAMLAIAEAWTFLARAWPERVREQIVALTDRSTPRLLRARARIVLTLSDPRASSGEVVREVQRAAAVTGARALLPAASAHPPWPRTTQPRSVPMIQDIVSILQACQQDDDPPAVVRRVTSMVRERTASAGVVVFSAEDCGLVPQARFGRLPQVRLGERAVTLRAPVGPEQEGGIWEAAWPILHRDALAGAIVCQWDRLEVRPAAELVSLAATAAAALGPVLDQLRAPRVPAPGPPGAIAELLGSSDPIIRVRQAIDRAALAPFSVVIEGESGVGKELVARAIHERSARRSRAFCAVNCAALTDELFEAELFGHARGAFTGAIAERAGFFEDADGGTLFLDEVIELSARAQAKLLRALQEGEIRRIGETRARRVDVRIIAAANRSLQSGVSNGSFRADLRFRLDVLRIEVPPLRARPEDIAALARHLWSHAAARVGSHALLGADVLAAFARYDWPGNVRELQNAVAALAAGAPARGTVRASALPAQIRVAESGVTLTLDEARKRFEAGFVRAAIARAGGAKARAAADLGLTRQGLAKLLDRLGLEAQTRSVNAGTGQHEEEQA